MNTALEAPGPWFVVTDEPDCVSLVGRKALGDLQDDEFIDCNSPDHARLVSAAPDLLNALQMLVAWDQTGQPPSNVCFAKARAAIVKATGDIP
jgi:hypothetical protein